MCPNDVDILKNMINKNAENIDNLENSLIYRIKILEKACSTIGRQIDELRRAMNDVQWRIR